MNEHDAALYAEDKGIEDGFKGRWDPPFRMSYCADIAAIYAQCYWLGFEAKTVEQEFPNG